MIKKKVFLVISFALIAPHVFSVKEELLKLKRIGKKGDPELYFSLLGNKDELIIPEKRTYGQLPIIPWIGVYSPDYQFRWPLAIIQLPPDFIPNTMQSHVAGIKKDDIYFNILFLRNYAPNINQKVFNMVYHPWASLITKQNLFNIKIPMGIFRPNGISPTPSNSIAFGKLKPETVNIHNGTSIVKSFSPNNARFRVANNRSISTFWAVTKYRKYANVAFIILLNDETIESSAEDAAKNALMLKDFLDSLENIATKDLQNQQDKQALRFATKQIKEIISQKQETDSSQLIKKLETLEGALKNLSGTL